MAVAGDIIIELKLDDSNMAVNVKKAGATLQQFQTTLNQTATSVKKLETAQDSIGTKFRHMVVTLGNLRFVAMDVHDVFLRLPFAIMKTAGELERTQALLGGLSKELTKAAKEAEAASNFKYITTMAQNAPFAISALSDSFVKFKSAGLDPTNGSMKALVDGVAKFGGNSESLHRAAIAIQQMAGKGVVSMEELRQQLGEAVPTAMRDMATGMGMSMAELTKAVSKGTVGATDAINKMLVVMGIRNEGAAKDMMNTWVGVQAQLKTRMELAAKEIADAGFGDATKKVAREISAALESIQFKQLADQTGQGLAEAVQGISTLAKILIDNAELIKSAATAWVIYKVASGAVGPVLMGAVDQIKKSNIEYKTQQSVLNQAAADAKNTALIQSRAAGDTARAQMTASAQSIAALKSELAQREAQRVQIQTNFAATSKTLLAYQPTGAFGPIDRAAVQEYARNLAKLDADNASAMRRIRGEITTVSASHAEAARSVMSHGNQLDVLANHAGRASRAMAGVAAAGRMAGNVFNLLGGWATVLNLAISAGIALWMNWGNAAEESAARVRRARMGLADAGDEKGLKKDKDEAGTKSYLARQELEWMAERGFNNSSIEFRRKQYAEKEAEIRRLEAKEKELGIAVSQAKVSTAKQRSSEETRNFERIADEQVEAIRASKNKVMLINDEKYAAELKAAGNNKALQDKAEKDNKNRIFKTQIQFGGFEVDALHANIEALKKGGDAAVAAAGTLREKASAARATVQMAVDGLNPNDIRNTKAPKAGPVNANDPDKIAGLIENVKERRAQLDAELGSLSETTNSADKVAGIVAKIQQKFKDGDFQYTAYENGKKVKKNATADQVQEYSKAMVDLHNQEELAKAQQKVGDFARGIAPDYAEAMEMLMNPLATAKRGAKESEFDRVLAKIGSGQLQTALAGVGTDLETLRTQAQAVDIAGVFVKMEEETKRLNDSMVTDDRNAAVQKMRAQNIEHANFMKNLLEKARASKMLPEEIAKLEKMLNDNTTARAAEVAEKSKTPMEKMAAQWANSTKNMEDATGRWANSAVDAFISMAKTGKMEWSSLADSIISDILRITLQKQMAGMLEGAASFLSGILPFADGGIMTSGGSMPLKKYAAGGIANSPQLAVFGEGRMNEAYVPLPDGRTIPVTMKGGTGGGNMVVNIIEAPGKGGETVSRQENGVNIMDIMVEKVSNKIAGDISRGTGSVNGAITTTFGLNRVAGAY